MSYLIPQLKLQKVPQLRFSGFSDDWKNKKLGDMDIFISDGNYGELYPKASEMINAGVPFIRANNIKNLKIIWDDMKYISKELHESLQSGHLKTGDILVTTRGEIGMLAYVDDEFNNANINAQICLLRCGREISSKFILNYFASRIIQKQFKELQTGSALKQLPKGNLAKLKIGLPSLREQQKIAEFLELTNSWIRNLGEQKESLKSYKKNLTKKIFIKDIRFKDSKGHEYPGWIEKKLLDCLDYQQPSNYIVHSTKYNDSYKIPVLTAGKTFILGYTNETDNIFSKNLPVIIFDDFTTTSQFVDFPFKVKSSAMKILLSKNGVNIKFLYEALQQIKYNVGGHGRHWISKYSKIKILLPSISEQQQIAEYLTTIDNLINSKQQQITLAEQWKKGLMQKLFI